jgi:regulator of sirC expression with transglutaminase-like and TPR domain
VLPSKQVNGMKTPASEAAPPVLSEGQKAALVKLLADEDPAVFGSVRRHILACGQSASSWLRPHALSDDPLIRRRVRGLLHHLTRLEADERFLAFCRSPRANLDLEAGLWLLAQTRYPDANAAAYSSLLDLYASQLGERIGPDNSGTSLLAVINSYLFEELGFRGNQAEYHEPENNYLNRVIDRRKGNPIGLSALYWLLAQRLKLPIVGIGMPGHFVCRYQTPTECYFIDVFNRGKLLNRANCISYLQNSTHGFAEEHLMPSTPARTLLRVCANLHQVYTQLELHYETTRVQRYLIALARRMS